jgi:hypothetical protein
MTYWHSQWQARYPAELCEVTVDGGGRRHRADVMGNGRVIEFEQSSISVDDINNRERFYGCMVWVFDARAPYSDDRADPVPRPPPCRQTKQSGRCHSTSETAWGLPKGRNFAGGSGRWGKA